MSKFLQSNRTLPYVDVHPTAVALPNPAANLPSTPYPGLRPFEQDEWPIFFGREKITRDIVDRLCATQIIFIHGSSGCGKSSFVRAGVLAQLARGCSRQGWQWQTAEMRPGSSPLWNLAEAIARIKHGSTAPSIEQIRTVRQQLNIGRRAFARISLDLQLGHQRHICLLLDQFEELFRFVQEIGLEEAELFAEIVCGFAEDPPEGIHLIVTVRSDHLGDFAQFQGLAEVVNRNQYLLPRLSDEDLLRAIREPATLYKGEIKIDVAMKLLRDSDGELDALPLIQHCLMRMWQGVHLCNKRVELCHYRGLRQGLSTHADEIFASAVDDLTSVKSRERVESDVESVFCALTAIDANGRHIRQSQTFGQLLDITELDPGVLNALLRPFREKSAGFITPTGVRDLAIEQIVDISHEALIRHWTKLAGSGSHLGWIQSEATDGQRYRALLEIVPGPLSRSTEKRWISWWQHRPRNASWASRYGGKFNEAKLLLDKTRKRQLSRRVIMSVVVGLILLSSGLLLYRIPEQARLQAEERLKSIQTARAISLASVGEEVLRRDGPTQGLRVAIWGLKASADASAASAAETLPIIPQTQRLAYRALQELREKYVVTGQPFVAPIVTFSPHSDLLLIGGSFGTAQIMNTDTGAIVQNIGIGNVKQLTAMKWSADDQEGRMVLFGRDDQGKSSVFSVHHCSRGSGSINADCAQITGPVGSGAAKLFETDILRTVSPDGRYALSGGSGAPETRLWSIRDKQVVHAGLPQSFSSAFNSDNTSSALVLRDRIQVYDSKTFSASELVAEEMAVASWRMTAVAFGPKNTGTDGKLFTATAGTARLWDLRTKESQTLPPPAAETLQAIFSPTGDSVAAALINGEVQVWRWRPDGRPVTFLLKGHTSIVVSLDFSRDGRMIATGSKDGTARVWQLRGTLAPEITSAWIATDEPQDHISGNNVLEERNGMLTVRDQASQEPFVRLNRKPHPWRAYGFAPGGVAATTQDGRRFFWTVFSGAAELLTFAQDHLPLCDGKRVASSDRGKALLLGLPDPSSRSTLGSGPVPDTSVGRKSDQSVDCGISLTKVDASIDE